MTFNLVQFNSFLSNFHRLIFSPIQSRYKVYTVAFNSTIFSPDQFHSIQHYTYTNYRTEQNELQGKRLTNN